MYSQGMEYVLEFVAVESNWLAPEAGGQRLRQSAES